MATPGELLPEGTPERGLSIAVAARVLGVPMPTLRSWERRYGMPNRARPLGATRRYSASDVQALRLMRDEIARGIRAGLAADSVRTLLSSFGPAAEFVNAILDASDRLDVRTIAQTLDQAAAELGLGRCMDDVLCPAMRQVGLRWQSGRCDVDQERLATQAVCAWLDKLAADAPQPADSRVVVLASGPRDLHTVGLRAFAVLLKYRGLRCYRTATGTSSADMVDAVKHLGCHVVVVVSHLHSARQQAIRCMRALDKAGTEVFYAGNAFAAARSRRGAPGNYLGIRLQEASSVIQNTLDSTVTPGRDAG
jgi:MerR family transcriptional regulator, light-induced transcriptional regulator